MGIKRSIKKSSGYDLIPLGLAFDEFITEKEARNLSPSTIRNYKQSYEYFMEFNGLTADNTTDEISQNMFYKWINTMKLEGVKFTSINHYLRDCRTFFYWCMDVDRRYVNPAFKINLLEGQEEQIKFFTDEDLSLLLEKPRRNEPFVAWRTWAIVNWVLATGNRAATICEVRIDDVDFVKKDIVLAHTKNKKAQTVPLSPSLETVLKEYCRMWRKEPGEEEWLFPNVGELQLTTNALRHSFAKYCNDRGVEQTNIHGLRHNFAKIWVQNDGNMVKLQKMLGHSTLEMTRRYVRLFGEDLKEDFEKVNPLDTMKRKANRTQKVKRSY